MALLAASALAAAWSVDAAPPPETREAPLRAELPSKPTGPIAVEHRSTAEPAVGVPLEIALTARVEGEVGALRIEAVPSSPLTALVTPPLLTSIAGGVYAWTVTVVPLADDAGYLNVIVSGYIDGVAQARTVTISLRSAPAEPVTPSARGAPGETLIALPVRESS